MALQEADALAPQDFRFFGGLDALRDGREIRTLGEAEQVAQEHLAFRAAGEIANERAVDLHGIDRQALQMAQRGDAGAEIVERDAAAGSAQRGDEARRFLDVVQRRGLGDLDDEAARELGLVAQLRGQRPQPRPVGRGQARRC